MDTFFGLPAHPLVAHLTVVAIPVAALLVVVVALRPRVSPLVKITTLALAALSVVLVPLMESSGEALEERVVESAAVERHTEMGETLTPWVIGLFVTIVAVLVLDRVRSRTARDSRSRSGVGGSTLLAVGLAVLSVAVAAGAVVQTVRIGHSGAEATWSTVTAPAPSPSEDDDD
ncbi:DUF2231 domain-containing protein [Mycolicibacterium austroafricanum]|uniref:DUF2231 domain-containing protein n=1 Tax=Mycolicibacterium austroafricanum TaxID=39687 RepID=UPI00055A8A49|nr:DUF2231 domain-containing protein [Mycolicibacterium austroafricanum]QZY46745.1 hypothetical protein K5L12_02955 [Mycolicibacterium austroafricanum]